MDLPFCISYIEYALEKEKEQYAWDLWKSIYPDMMKGHMDYISFNDFNNILYSKQYKYTSKTSEEIEQEFSEIIEFYKNKK